MIYDLLKMSSSTDLKDKFDIILVVSGFKAKYLKPAKFEQEIRVFSEYYAANHQSKTYNKTRY